MKHRLQRQKPQLSAAEINRWNRAALQLQYDRYRDPPTRFELPNNQVWVRNDGFYDLPPYTVGRLDTLLWDYEATDFLASPNSQIPTPLDYAYSLKTIETGDYYYPPAVVQSYIPRGGFGPAAIYGKTKALVRRTTPSGDDADNDPDNGYGVPAFPFWVASSLTGGNLKLLHPLQHAITREGRNNFLAEPFLYEVQILDSWTVKGEIDNGPVSAATGSTPDLWGSGEADSPFGTVTVYNPTPTAIPNAADVFITNIGRRYVAYNPDADGT